MMANIEHRIGPFAFEYDADRSEMYIVKGEETAAMVEVVTEEQWGEFLRAHRGAVALLEEVRKRSSRPFGGHAPYDLAARIGRFLDDGVYEPHPDAGGQ
jgi:hypothetical protein